MSPLVDSSGMPLRLPLDQQVGALRNELHFAFSVIQQLRLEILNQALKTQYLIRTLSDRDLLPDNLNEGFQVFARGELARMEAEAANSESPEETETAIAL